VSVFNITHPMGEGKRGINFVGRGTMSKARFKFCVLCFNAKISYVGFREGKKVSSIVLNAILSRVSGIS